MREDPPPFDHAKLAAARLQACDRWPYFSSGLLAMHVVESPGLGTFGVDRHWRLYIDPEALARWSVAQVAVVLNHELQHLLRSHAERAQTLGIDHGERFAWNLAADAEINDDLFDELDAATRTSLPAVTPKTLKQPPGRMAEYYFQQVRNGPKSAFDEGPGVHGFPDDRFPVVADNNVAVSPTEAAVIRRGVAAAVRQHFAGRSAIGAGLQRWADATLGISQDWRVILAGAVRRQCAQVAGLADYSYVRISRRGASNSQILMPSMVKPAMSNAVVIDTSGSVTDQMLGDALCELTAIARSVGQSGATTHVIACDAAASHPAVVKAARTMGPLAGGGGTDMRVGIRTALDIRPRPHAVVVLTDGFSPWPAERPAVPVIVGLLGKAASDQVPQWASAVLIE